MMFMQSSTSSERIAGHWSNGRCKNRERGERFCSAGLWGGSIVKGSVD